MIQKKVMPKRETIADSKLNILLEEVRQALNWSRPSILIAVHQSKNDQSRIIAAMRTRLEGIVEVVNILPERGSKSILNQMIETSDFYESVFFVHGMGGKRQVYEGLNMFRELIVEKKLKIIFWLTNDEMCQLARQAPDFWAFRHRVIEFPAVRNSPGNSLPSGVLLWHLDDLILPGKAIREKIAFHEQFIQNFSKKDETVASYLHEFESLSYYYWLLGENQKVDDLINHIVDQFNLSKLNDLHSMLLNVRAINCFDQSNFQDALRWIDQALKLSPEQAVLWSNYGVICRSASQARKSFPSLKMSVKLDPASPKGWVVLGYMYILLGKYVSAIPYFEKALSIQPNTNSSHLAIAICYSRIGNMEELGRTLQYISNISNGKDYYSACCSGLLGDASGALTQLKEWMLTEKIPRIWLRRDPALHFIFEASSLQNLLQGSEI